jgi:rare lipoprotein A
MKCTLKFIAPLLSLSLLFSSFTTPPAEIGNAVIIEESLQGKKTACEKLYDKEKLTAAHKTIPCGTKVKVTNLENNKSAEVIIIDRGPYVKGQIIALSTKAAVDLGMTKDVESKVKVEVLTESKEKVSAIEKKPSKVTDNKKTVTKDSKAKDPELNVVQEAAEIEKGGLYKMQVLKLEPKGFGVQVAGYSNYEAVIQQVSVLQKNWFKGALVFADQMNNKPYYKIIMGPFFTKEEADSYCENLKKKYSVKDAFVVDLQSLKVSDK